MNKFKTQCPSCGANINIGDKKCDYCNSEFKVRAAGKKIDLKSRSCPYCKFNSDIKEDFCPSCGDNLRFNCPHCFSEGFIVTKHCNKCGKDISNLSQNLINKDYLGIASYAESFSDINIDSSIEIFKKAYTSQTFDIDDADAPKFLIIYAELLNKKYIKLLNTNSGPLLGSIYAEKEKLVKTILDGKASQAIKDRAQNLLINREKKVKEGCFIATATLGKHNHPVVIQLQDFRDEYLLKYGFGKSIINIYYKYSPFWADIIKRHNIFRKLSYTFIIYPIYILSLFAKSKKIFFNKKR